MFSHVQQFDVIFVDEMGPSYTHLSRSVRSVVEHPKLDSCVEGTLGVSTVSSLLVVHMPTYDFRHCCDL